MWDWSWRLWYGEIALSYPWISILWIIFLCSWTLIGKALLQPGLMVLAFAFYWCDCNFTIFCFNDLIVIPIMDDSDAQSCPSCAELCECLATAFVGEEPLEFGASGSSVLSLSTMAWQLSRASGNCLIGFPFDNHGVHACWSSSNIWQY